MYFKSLWKTTATKLQTPNILWFLKVFYYLKTYQNIYFYF
jgi:hypothetical protein